MGALGVLGCKYENILTYTLQEEHVVYGQSPYLSNYNLSIRHLQDKFKHDSKQTKLQITQ